MFGEKLNEYIERLGCSGKELAEKSGLSEAAVSRLRTGGRVPKQNSAEFEKLCRGIVLIAEDSGADGCTAKEVSEALGSCIIEESFNHSAFSAKLNLIFRALSVNVAELSKALSYDSSHISRIRNGQRRSSRPEKLAAEISEYVAKKCTGPAEKEIIAELLKTSAERVESVSDCAAALTDWLTGGESAENAPNPMSDFLEKLSEFDLNQYIRAIHFDEIKVPSVPAGLPISKSYYGLEQMKKGELDFLKATALSRSKEPVFMCSDMQMDDMAKDMDFAKKYMFGLAVMLKKGLHLNVVHNLNRPFKEIMLGFESWIPLYMTGQISPYYLKGVHNRVYCHFLNVSGAAALVGDCIAGHHSRGRYYLAKGREELGYYREKAGFILKKALPLMEIYRSDSADVLDAFLLADSRKPGLRKNILSAMPLYTMDLEYLELFLEKRSVQETERRKILNCARVQKQLTENILSCGAIEDEIPELTREEFEKYPISLALSTAFYEKDIAYSYEEYLTHLEQTAEFARKNTNYSMRLSKRNAFRNIQITVHEGEWAMLSKNKSPAIHSFSRYRNSDRR